ncbi:MAG: glycosyltransferase family 2 protein [Methylocystaceae bacterium]
MKITLIMATVGRTDEVARFLAYLEKQTYHDFELIIVDSNEDKRLVPLINKYGSVFSIIYQRFGKSGVSRARNYGLKFASGDIIGFPDDDSWYPQDLLAEAAEWFNRHPEAGGLIGRVLDERGNIVVGKFNKTAQVLDRYGAWGCASTNTMFWRRNVLPAPPVFKEDLGVGTNTLWGCAEDTQLLIKIIDAGELVWYQPSLIVYHPDPYANTRQVLHRRGYLYGCGVGYVMGTNGYPSWFYYYYLGRCLGALILAVFKLDRKRADHHWQTLKGRRFGWKTAGQMKPDENINSYFLGRP